MGNLFARAPAKVAASEASASRAAPNLAAYFELMEASVIETDELVATALDAARLHALRERRARGRVRLAELVRASVKRHDPSGRGSLDKESSRAFFEHYVELWVPYARRVGARMAVANALVSGRADAALARLPAPATPELRRALADAAERVVVAKHGEHEATRAAYFADEARRAREGRGRRARARSAPLSLSLSLSLSLGDEEA